MKNFNRNYTGELNDLAGASLYLGLCKVKGIELDELSRIDTLTPFYRNKINQLSPQKRKILATLVREGKPLRIRELSESARITQYGGGFNTSWKTSQNRSYKKGFWRKVHTK